MAEQDAGKGQTRGHRVYLIREALGTRRDALPMQRFAELIEQTTGAVYDKSTLSRMETGERKVSVEDIEAIAPVDPLKRGKAWLAGWDDERKGEVAATVPVDPSAFDRPAPTKARQIPTERVEPAPARVESPKRRKPSALAAVG